MTQALFLKRLKYFFPNSSGLKQTMLFLEHNKATSNGKLEQEQSSSDNSRLTAQSSCSLLDINTSKVESDLNSSGNSLHSFRTKRCYLCQRDVGASKFGMFSTIFGRKYENVCSRCFNSICKQCSSVETTPEQVRVVGIFFGVL